MISFADFCRKMHRKLLKIRFRPIRVFCFHQVSEVFEPDTMWKCDWTQTEQFKSDVLELKKKYTFISLSDVTKHLRHDFFRFKNYAALTADDGWASLKNIIPWLAEQKVPVTLFINPAYLDGVHYQKRETEKLLTQEEVEACVKKYYPLIDIASHGWIHKSCLEMTDEEFQENVKKSEEALMPMEGKTGYYAFAYGNNGHSQISYLKNNGLIPVFMDGCKNYNDESSIHRELLDRGFGNNEK